MQRYRSTEKYYRALRFSAAGRYQISIFHFPFSIFHSPFEICHFITRNCQSSSQSMANDKSQMENGKWKIPTIENLAPLLLRSSAPPLLCFSAARPARS